MEVAGPVAIVVTLGDQPLISAAAIDATVAASGYGSPAARATYDGVPGHPVVIPPGLFPAVARLRGDHGARQVLRTTEVTTVDCSLLGSAVDVDTVADLERLRSREADATPRSRYAPAGGEGAP